MALAVLGQRCVKEQNGNYDEIKRLLDQPDAAQLADAADRLGQLWAALTRQVRSASKEGLAKPTVEESEQALGLAARHARLLDGAGAAYLATDPVAALRRLQWHDWLCWQARRTLRDHWFYDDGTNPYYTVAGLAYVQDAMHLASVGLDESSLDKKKREGQATELAARLVSELCHVRWRDGADFTEQPATLDITDERTLEWVYRIEVPKAASPGHVVYQGKEATGREWFVAPADKRGAPWDATPLLNEASPTYDAKFPLTPKPNPRYPIQPDRSKLEFVAFFRGQKVPLDTDVRLHRVPDVTWHHRRMPLGAIAVQADASLFRAFHLNDAELVIVLDASGSMGAVDGSGRTRYQRALDGLRSVLEQLPQGVRLSLWVFSHKGSRGRQPEQMWPVEPWVAAKLPEKMAKLTGLIPEGDTPLINSMVKAKQDFTDRKVSRTMVVITDGGDSVVPPDSIREILEREFTSANIRIRAIGFELKFPDTPEGRREEQGAKKFKDYLDSLKDKGFFPANNARELVDRLRRSMFQMDFLLASAKLDQAVERQGGVSQLGDNPLWLSDVRPGWYNLQVRFLGQRLSAEERLLYLGPGECMVVNVRPTEQGKGLVLQRDLFTRPLTPRLGSPLKVEPSPNNEWLAAIHQNRARDDGSLELMATLEKTVNREPPSNGTLRHFKPHLVLFEVRRGGNNKPLPLKFGTLPNYRAPAYALDAREGGGRREDKTIVDAWWTENFLSPDINHPYSRILQFGKKDGFSEGFLFREVPAKLGPGQWTDNTTGQVVLDSVRIEELDVETSAESPLTRGESCLVVRLHFPKGKPFLVRLPDPAGEGADPARLRFEHRIYFDARKYTGIFPGWTAEDLRSGNLQLELVSLEGFKDPAAGTNHVRFELEAPQPSSHRPQKDCLTRFDDR
jgi:hypothetical protein